MTAFSPQAKPAHDGQVLPQGELFFAKRAERAARLVHRHAQRQPIDDDVEKRANAGTNHARRDQPDPMLEGRIDQRHVHHLSISAAVGSVLAD